MVHNNPKERIVITPIIDPKEQFGPSSFDLRLGTEFKVFRKTKYGFIDPGEKKKEEDLERKWRELTEDIKIGRVSNMLILHPGEFALASTLEYIMLPDDIVGELHGRSSWGRLGLMIHATAGFVDPGFCGVLTYELVHAGSVPIYLYPGTRIGHITFTKIEPTSKPYKGKYLGITGVISSRLFEDKEFTVIRDLKEIEDAKKTR
jgi:dCTP deaminase